MNKNERFVITINREVGTGGRTVGRKLAEKLGVKYYDKAVIQGLTEKFGLSSENIEEIKAKKKTASNNPDNLYQNLVTTTMFDTEKRILQDLATRNSCVVAGRTGFLVFREWPNHLNIFIQASMEHRIQRVMKRQNVSEQEARDIITKMDTTREAYIKKYVDTSRYDTRNYQLVISMDDLSEDDAAEVIMDYINRTSK